MSIKNSNQQSDSLFFDDGTRRIDYVLAFKELDQPGKTDRRATFEKNLREHNLELELQEKEFSQDGDTYFLKIHAPWEVLCKQAEMMALRMPIQANDTGLSSEGYTSAFTKFFMVDSNLLPPERDNFTADFNVQRMDMFTIEDKESFFSMAQRSMMVHELLLRTQYDDSCKARSGIDHLLKQGIYTAAYPLHEGAYKDNDNSPTSKSMNTRKLLYETWARPGRFWYFQPLDLVSNEICDSGQTGNLTMCPLCDAYCPYWKLVESCSYAKLTYLFDNAGTVFFACFMAIWATMFLEFWKRKQAEIQYNWDVTDYELEERVRPDFEAKCTKRKLNPITQVEEPYLPLRSKIGRTCTSLVVVLFMITCMLVAVFGVIMYRVVMRTVQLASSEALIRRNARISTTVTAALINLVVILILNRIYTRVAVFLTDLERPRTDTQYEDSLTIKMFMFQFINFYSSIFYIAFFKGRLSGRPGDYDYSLGYRQEECDPAGCLTELCIQLAIVMIGKQTLNNFKELMLPLICNWINARRSSVREKDEVYTRFEQDYDLRAQPDLGLFDEYLEMVIQYGFVTIFVAAFPLAPLFALINNVIEIRLDAYKFVTQWRRPVALRDDDIGIWYGILKAISYLSVVTNAFIISYTSDFIPKIVYMYTVSPNHDLHGYVNFSLSTFNVSDFQPESFPLNNGSDAFGEVTECRYTGYRHPPGHPKEYQYTEYYWNIFTYRLAFVICFEHVVFFLTWIVAYLIPDVSENVRLLILREHYLTKEARYNAVKIQPIIDNMDEDEKEISV